MATLCSSTGTKFLRCKEPKPDSGLLWAPWSPAQAGEGLGQSRNLQGGQLCLGVTSNPSRAHEPELLLLLNPKSCSHGGFICTSSTWLCCWQRDFGLWMLGAAQHSRAATRQDILTAGTTWEKPAGAAENPLHTSLPYPLLFLRWSLAPRCSVPPSPGFCTARAAPGMLREPAVPSPAGVGFVPNFCLQGAKINPNSPAGSGLCSLV